MDEPRATTRPRSWRMELLVVLLILAAWLGLMAALTGSRRMILLDTFRDLAWTENILAGRLWRDPAVAGQAWWYPPGGPLLAASVAALTRHPPVDVYGWNRFWCNAALPVALYLLVRRVWDRVTALLALATVFLGSFWWLTHAAAGIPGIQGVPLTLAALGCWHRTAVGVAGPIRPTAAGAWGWPLVTGLLLAAAAWYHPLCGLIPAGALAVQVLMQHVAPGRAGAGDPGVVRPAAAMYQRLLLVAAVAAGLTAPLIWHLLKLPVRNAMPLQFFASELLEPAFYAQARTPLVLLAAAAGTWQIARGRPEAYWAVGYLLVGLAGQAAGYLAWYHDLPVPFLLPHEFQWHGQMATGILAAVGIAGLARGAGRRLRPGRPATVTAAAAILLATAAAGPGLRGWREVRRYLLDLEPRLAQTRAVREWIRANTDLEAVFICTPEVGFELLSGLTGRKCLAVSPGHTNPAVDWLARAADLAFLLNTPDEQAFQARLRGHRAEFLLQDAASPADLAVLDERYRAWHGLRPVFRSLDPPIVIYRLERGR